MEDIVIIAAIAVGALGVYVLLAYAMWRAILRHRQVGRLKQTHLAVGIGFSIFAFLVQLIRHLLALGETSWTQVWGSPLFVALIFAINYGLLVLIERHDRTNQMQ